MHFSKCISKTYLGFLGLSDRKFEFNMSFVFILQEKVLHNIMAIFTFMGANIMRLDDAYSFRVIDKTVQMVVPALIQVSV